MWGLSNSKYDDLSEVLKCNNVDVAHLIEHGLMLQMMPCTIPDVMCSDMEEMTTLVEE